MSTTTCSQVSLSGTHFLSQDTKTISIHNNPPQSNFSLPGSAPVRPAGAPRAACARESPTRPTGHGTRRAPPAGRSPELQLVETLQQAAGAVGHGGGAAEAPLVGFGADLSLSHPSLRGGAAERSPGSPAAASGAFPGRRRRRHRAGRPPSSDAREDAPTPPPQRGQRRAGAAPAGPGGLPPPGEGAAG